MLETKRGIVASRRVRLRRAILPAPSRARRRRPQAGARMTRALLDINAARFKNEPCGSRTARPQRA